MFALPLSCRGCRDRDSGRGLSFTRWGFTEEKGILQKLCHVSYKDEGGVGNVTGTKKKGVSFLWGRDGDLKELRMVYSSRAIRRAGLTRGVSFVKSKTHSFFHFFPRQIQFPQHRRKFVVLNKDEIEEV
jgi:hypothetical protein